MSGAEPPAGWSPGVGRPTGGQRAKPPKVDEVFVFKTVIFNASAAVFHEVMYCLCCFFCAQVYGAIRNVVFCAVYIHRPVVCLKFQQI